MSRPKITIITPTTGEKSLLTLMDSILSDNLVAHHDVEVEHLLLWDAVRTCNGTKPDLLERFHNCSYDYHSIILPGLTKQGNAPGSMLRAIGLMVATGDYVTFADSDVWYEKDHLQELLTAIDGKNWAYTKRTIWENPDKRIGMDEFESMGEESKFDYKFVDNSSMMFKRKFGSSAATLYRETVEYNDDRQMYKFLMKYAGSPGQTNKATVNQICPEKLISFFEQGCTK